MININETEHRRPYSWTALSSAGMVCGRPPECACGVYVLVLRADCSDSDPLRSLSCEDGLYFDRIAIADDDRGLLLWCRWYQRYEFPGRLWCLCSAPRSLERTPGTSCRPWILERAFLLTFNELICPYCGRANFIFTASYSSSIHQVNSFDIVTQTISQPVYMY